MVTSHDVSVSLSTAPEFGMALWTKLSQDVLQVSMVLCVWIAGVDWKAVRDFVDASDSLHEFAHPEGIAQPHDG